MTNKDNLNNLNKAIEQSISENYAEMRSEALSGGS